MPLPPADRASLVRLLAGGAGWIEWIGLFVAALVLAAGLLVSHLADPLDAVMYDATVRATPHTSDPRILIVAIDEASVRDLGRWPWARAQHAALLDRLTAARPAAVGYDVLFVDPSTDDAALAGALAREGRVALPLLIASPGDNGAPFRVTSPVVPSAAQGHVVVRTDADGVFRRVTPVEDVSGRKIEHLALATVRMAGSHPDPAGNLISFAGPPGTYPSVAFSAVLHGDVPVDLLRDRIVLVGATAAGLGDRFAVPTGGDRDLMAGVEVQANIVDSLLHGNLREIAPLWASFACAAFALLALWIGFLFVGPRANLIAAVAIVAGILVVALTLLLGAGLWIRPASALVAIVIMFPLWGWRRLAAASGFLDSEIARLDHESGSAEVDTFGGDRLQRQMAMLDAATVRMQLLRRQRDETLAFLSHDLRSPAAAILSIVDPASKDAHDVRVTGHARRMLRLADQFVQGARAEEAPLAIERIDLAEALVEAADFCWEAAERVGGSVDVDADLDAVAVEADPALFSRALINLIDNALKYGEKGSAVLVRGWCAGDRAIVTVADRGPGLSDTQVAALFGRYERVGATRPDGAGLGLALVETFAHRHDGTVTCVSRPGTGTLFQIDLPRAH